MTQILFLLNIKNKNKYQFLLQNNKQDGYS